MIENERYRAHGRAVVGAAWFLLAAALWVIGLFLLFLATGWPRWGFYAAVLVGAVALVQLNGRRSSNEAAADGEAPDAEPQTDGPDESDPGVHLTDGGPEPECAATSDEPNRVTASDEPKQGTTSDEPKQGSTSDEPKQGSTSDEPE